MIDPVIKIVSIIIGVLIIYAIPCFLAHYIDFGWKFSSGKWFHEDFSLVKKLRSGVFHKILIGLILVILLYAGLSEIVIIIPADWGYTNKTGQLQPYRKSLATILAVLLGVINLYAFSVADRYFAEKEKAVRKDNDSYLDL